MELKGTADVYFGLEAPSQEAWARWHRGMLEARRAPDVDRSAMDPTTAWSDLTFRQFFLFMYDTRFWSDGRYHTDALVDGLSAAFGRVDSVLLWHAYPRLGFDARDQFDFYRDMPGGLARLRADVVDVLHARGIRVFVDYNPWAAGSHDALAEIVAALDADGVMLDTLTEAPGELAAAIARRKRGVVLAPELRPRTTELARLRQSWAQWSDLGEEPAILRNAWLVPRHRQLTIRRWDTSRRDDIVWSFFNGAGLLLWDNVFGTWNPYDRADRRLAAETGAVLDRYGALFTEGTWLPLVPTGTAGLDANRWQTETRAIVTFRNRTDRPRAFPVPDDAPSGLAYGSFWGDGAKTHGPGERIEVAPFGTAALVLDDPAALEEARVHFRALAARADVALPGYDARTPRPVRRAAPHAPRDPHPASPAPKIALPGGTFEMNVRHPRRECGCVPDGASDDAMWGWFYKDTIEHRVEVTLRPFAMRATAVTNAEMLAFVHAARYRPDDDARFLAHLRTPDGALPAAVPPAVGALPVTFVSLADARAFAAWHGERLPTEAEWQWAAEGAGAGLRFPWGDEARGFPASLRAADDPATATPQGVMGLSGNAWELTESEHDDGHTRFVLLRGGVFLGPDPSEWVVERGARPNDHHAKYILMSDGLDRSATVSFRTVVDR